MSTSQPSKNAVKGTRGSGGTSTGQLAKFAWRTASGRYVSSSKDEALKCGEASGDYTNYTVHIPGDQHDTSVATKAEEQYVSSSLFKGGFNSVIRAHILDKVIGSEVTQVMKDERGVDITPCKCRFKICRECFIDARKKTGLCPGCKEPYRANDDDGYSMKRNKNGEISGTYVFGNAYCLPSGDGKGGDCGGFGDLADKPWRPLTRRIPIPMSIISSYRLLIVIRFIVLCFFLTWRVTHVNDDAVWLWFMSIVCEIWFAFFVDP